MIRYIPSKIAQAMAVLLGAYLITFIGIHLLPSDPITTFLMSNEMALDPASVVKMKSYYGFDKPLPQQFLAQLLGLFQGNLGYSLRTGRPVAQEIGDVLSPTLQLTGAALGLALAITFGIVAMADLTKTKWVRTLVSGIPPLLGAIPSFWLGMALLQLLSFKFKVMSIFPDGTWLSLFAPASVLAIYVSAPLAQVMLKSVDNARSQPFINAVRAKGASRSWVFYHHVLKYAAGSGVTVLGLTIGNLLAGAVVTETVFSRPGVGRILKDAVSNQDIALVQGFVLWIAALYVLVNFMVDAMYPLLDPRVLRQRSARAKGGRT